MRKNPLSLLRKYIPMVLRGSIHMIVSVLEIPTGTRYKTPKRVVYHLDYYVLKATGFQDYNYVNVVREIFPINRDPLKDSEAKYEIIGDIGIGGNSQYVTDATSINLDKIIRLFIRKNIDTIVITDRNGDNVKILYDATGYLEVGKRFLENTNSWRRQRLAAELTGNPETLRQMGYFEEQPGDDRKLIEKLRRESYEEPPQRIFDFGKRSRFGGGVFSGPISRRRYQVDSNLINYYNNVNEEMERRQLQFEEEIRQMNLREAQQAALKKRKLKINIPLKPRRIN